MKKSSIILIILIAFLFLPYGVFASDIEPEPVANPDPVIDEIKEFQSEVNSRIVEDLETVESSDNPLPTAMPESAPSPSLSPDDEYLKEFKEYRHDVTVSLQSIFVFLCIACGILICVCVVRFIHHD